MSLELNTELCEITSLILSLNLYIEEYGDNDRELILTNFRDARLVFTGDNKEKLINLFTEMIEYNKQKLKEKLNGR